MRIFDLEVNKGREIQGCVKFDAPGGYVISCTTFEGKPEIRVDDPNGNFTDFVTYDVSAVGFMEAITHIMVEISKKDI